MEENTQFNEISPIEKYSFKYDEDETKLIHQKQLKPTINALIASVIFAIALVFYKFVSDMPNILFGVFLGIFLIYIIVYLRGILLFQKNAKVYRSAMQTREYVYSIFDGTLKIEIYEEGNKIAEENRKYSEIQAVNDIGAYLLLTFANRIFVIRKSEISEQSLLYTRLSIQKTKTAKKKRKIALIVFLICAVLAIILGTLGKTYEKYTNNQAVENMKATIEKTYDDYELLTWFNVHKDGRFVDAFIIIESNGKVDVLGYASQNDELITVEKFIGLTPELENTVCYLSDGSSAVIKIYPKEADIPDTVDIKSEIKYQNQTMYFCLTFAE